MKILIKLRELSPYSLKLDLKMKLSIYLFLFSLFQIHANTYSQNTKITLKLENVSVEEVLREIEAQTEFKILYNDNDLNYNREVSVNVKNTLVLGVLDQLFENTNIKYKTVGKQIVLIKKPNKTDQITKDLTVKGVVKDDLGMPIPGANIIVKGTSTGVITDFDGNYSIKVKDSDAILVFSYIGFKTKEVAVDGNNKLNVVLESDLGELAAVVLVGYGTVKKSDITGSIASIKTEDIQSTQNVSIAQAIQGRAAGVTATKSSGTPGANPTITIRGAGTVRNSGPLYIVDGIPINDITNINMADAASVEVLKDASATAIYGSRAANGVILIQTKKGKKGTPSISYSTYYGVQRRVDNLDILDAEGWARIFNEAIANDDPNATPKFSDPASLKSYNWKDAIYESGSILNHQLSFSGGTDKSSYYVSLGHLSQKGIVKESKFERTNFRINNSYQIKPKVKVGHNIQYAIAKRVTVPEFGGNPWQRAAFVGYLIEPLRPISEDGSKLSTVDLDKSFTSAINPFSLVKYGQRPRTRESFLGNLFLEADILKGLTFKSNFGLEINNTKVDYSIPIFDAAPTYSNDQVSVVANRAENRVLIWSNTLNYNTTIEDKHSINVLLGQELQHLNSNNLNAARSGVPASVAEPTISSGDLSTSTNGGNIGESKLISFFGRVNYNYDDRYLVTGTYRADASSRFGANNRWAYFPSLALAWNLHKENFYDIEAINQLKFRLGWGEIGNQNIPGTAVFNTLNLATNSVFGLEETTTSGVAPLRSGNPNLKWETTISSNIGLDMAFLKNSITLTADYFIKNTTDLLLQVPSLQTSGFQNDPFGNAGDIENKGFEFSANYRKRINDFSFSLGGNISFIDNKVIELAEEGSIIQSGNAQGFRNIGRTEAGHALASFYGYKTDGIFQTQEEVDNSAIINKTKPGDVKYQDLNGDGVINADDRTYIGSPFADFTYGFNLDMSYKQFDFSAFFQGSEGNDIFNASAYYLEADAGGTNFSTKVLGRWTGEGTSNTIPRVTIDNNGVNTQLSDRFVRDGSYLRLKNIQLGYSVPKYVLDKMLVNKFRVYVAAQNLLTFTKYDGLDPEIGIDSSRNNPLDIGIDRGRYPSTRTFTLGLDINF